MHNIIFKQMQLFYIFDALINKKIVVGEGGGEGGGGNIIHVSQGVHEV